jgi:ABC-type uncharacterized transport system substrate-binding protein
MAINIARRKFIVALGGTTVAWPLRARAQQPPVVGWLGSGWPDLVVFVMRAFHQGLKETGYVDGRNVVIEYRWAEGQYDRLPALAADLVRRQVAVIVATPTPATLSAKAATTTIPIIFATGGDPVELGLVASLNRPGGNLTGVSILSVPLVAKRLELLHELVPNAKKFALLVNPANKTIADSATKGVETVTQAFGLELQVLTASTEHDFEPAFATLIQRGAGALVISADAFFNSKRDQLVALAARYAVPTIYETRDFVSAGGLMSYGASFPDMYRQVGIYTGRILKGEKAADLPVQQAVKIEMAVNLKTAKTLGLTFPLTLLGLADEVIE